MEAYKIEHLNKSYADKEIFNDLNLSISEHERIGLVGINGTGKSTLLKVIGGLDEDFTETIDIKNYQEGSTYNMMVSKIYRKKDFVKKHANEVVE